MLAVGVLAGALAWVWCSGTRGALRPLPGAASGAARVLRIAALLASVLALLGERMAADAVVSPFIYFQF